jgi:hypothetical protein
LFRCFFNRAATIEMVPALETDFSPLVVVVLVLFVFPFVCLTYPLA